MAFTFQPKHDHNHCITAALKRAETVCLENGQRFTKIRRLVFNMVWQSHKPIGAYELLPAMKSAGFNSAPPTVYRALEFLQQQGLVHRISSLNAFIGCSHPGHKCSSYFLICDHCQLVVELQSPILANVISDVTLDMGFRAQREHLEVVGKCPNCQASSQSSSAKV